MKQFRRKRQLRNRIIASVMAIAMVFTVIRIGASDGVKAGEGADKTYTDETQIKTILDDAFGNDLVNYPFSAKTYLTEIYEAGSKVRFELPDLSSVNEISNPLFFYLNGTDVATTTNSADLTGKVYVEAKYSYSYGWEDDKKYLSAGESAKLNVTASVSFNSMSEGISGENEDKLKDAARAKCNNIPAFEISCANIEVKDISLVASVSGDTVSLDDTSWVNGITYNEEKSKYECYYGAFSYAAVKADSQPESAPSQFKSIDEAENDFKVGGVTKRGKYFLYRRYDTNAVDTEESGSKVFFTDVEELNIEYDFVKAASVTVGTLSSSDLTEDEGVKKLSLTGADPNDDLVISLEFDSAGSASVKGDSTLNTSITADSGKYTGSITIPANEDNANKTVTTEIELTSEDNYKKNLSVSVSYTDGGFTISDAMINDTNSIDNYITDPFITKAVPSISANIECGVKISSVKLYKVASEGDDTGFDFSVVSGSKTAEAKWTLSLDNSSIAEGSNEYYIEAQSVAGTKVRYPAGTDTFKILYDKTAPTVNNVEFIQNEETIDVSSKKLTKERDITIKFGVTEEGSGVKSAVVKFNGTSYTASLDEGKYAVTIPKASLETIDDGASNIPYGISVVDKADNGTSAAAKEGKVNFYKEKAEITITPNFDVKVFNPDTKKYTSELSFTVTAESEAAISSIEAKDGSGNKVSLVPDQIASSDGKFVYKTSEIEKVEGEYKFSVTTTNVNDFKSTSEVVVYYVDITAPNPVIVGYSDLDSEQVVEEGKWYRTVYVLVDYVDEGSGVDKDSIAVTGMTAIEGREGAYKVNNSTSSSGTTVTVSAKDRVGNGPKNVSATFYVDSAKPTIEEFKLNDVTALGGSTLYTKEELTGSFAIKDNIGVAEWAVTVTDADGHEKVTSRTYGATEFKLTDSITGSFSDVVPAEALDSDGKVKDGKYTVVLSAYDKAGEPITKRTVNVVCDTKGPEVEIKATGLEGPPKLTGKVIKNSYVSKNDSSKNYDYYKYTNYTNGNVLLTFTVKDVKVDPATIVVTNNNQEVTDLTWQEDSVTGIYSASKEISTSGEYSFEITATDVAGNVAEKDAMQKVVFTGDVQGKPAILKLNGERYDETKNVFKENVTLSWYNKNEDTAIDAELDRHIDSEDIKVTTCKKDGEDYTPPTDLTFTEDGSYEVVVTAIDLAGNVATSSAEFSIDKTVPDVFVSEISGSTAGKSSKTYTEANTERNHHYHDQSVNYDGYYKGIVDNVDEGVAVTVKVFEKNLSSVDVYDFNEDNTTAKQVPVEFTKNGDEYVATFKVTAERYHRIKVSAVDTSGNQGTFGYNDENYISFVIDNTDPDFDITVNGSKAGDSVNHFNTSVEVGYEGNITATSGGAAILKTDANEDINDIVLKYTYTPAGGSAGEEQTISDFGTSVPKKFTEDGLYEVRVTVRDMVGNETVKEASFVIDSVVPEIAFEEVKGTASKISSFNRNYTHSGEHYSSKSFTYGAYYNDKSGVEVKLSIYDANISRESIKVYDNDKELSPTLTKVSDYEYIATVVVKGDGEHVITASAKDVSGQEGSDPGVTFTIDTGNPIVGVTVNDNVIADNERITSEEAVVGFTVQDDNIDKNDIIIEYTHKPFSGGTINKSTESIEIGRTKVFTADGEYTVTITAKDCAGNSGSKTVKFLIDNTKPELDIRVKTDKPAKFNKYKNTYVPAVEGHFTKAANGYEYGQFYKNDVTLRITGFDYDAASFKVVDNGIDIGASFAKNESGEYVAEVVIKSEGKHEIKAIGVDNSHNEGFSSVVSFTIDKTAPVINPTLDGVLYKGMNSYRSSDTVVGVSVEDDNKDESDLKRAYEITMSDGSSVKKNTANIGEVTETYKDNAMHIISYKAVDKAGNEGTITIGFLIDNTKPQSDIIVTTKAPAKMDKFYNDYSNTGGHFNTKYRYGKYYAENVSFDVKVFEYNVASITVTDNGEDITPKFTDAAKGEKESKGIVVSGEGSHDIAVTVVDKSGNSSTKNIGFVIDKTPPELYATVNNSSEITNRFLATDATVTLGVSDDNEDEDVTRVVRMTRPSSSTETTSENGDLEGSSSYSTEADYEIVYKAVDRAGNESSELKVSFRVDKTAPKLTITGVSKDGTSAQDTTITFNMEEAFYWDMNAATVRVYKKVDGAVETLLKTIPFNASGTNSALSELFKEDGQYRFEFEAEDKTGNKANESFAFTLDQNAPIITLTGVDKYYTNKDVTFGVRIEETFFTGNNINIEGTRKTLGSDKAEAIEFDDYSVLRRSSSANFEQIFSRDGVYNIKVTSKDIAGNETVQTVKFTIDKTKPVIKDIEQFANEEEYKAYSDALKANDPDAKKLIPILNKFEFDYDVDDVVKDLTTVTYKLYLDDVLYDGLSKVDDGFHELKIVAEDEVGNSSERSFYFILDSVNPVIIVAGVENGDNLKEPTTITVSLQLAEDTLTSVKLNGSDMAIESNTATFEVNQKGKYELVVSAVDEAGNISESVIKFEYGKTSGVLWIILGILGGAVLLGLILFILGKRRRNR